MAGAVVTNPEIRDTKTVIAFPVPDHPMSEAEAEIQTDRPLRSRIPVTMYISILGIVTMGMGYVIDLAGWPTIGGLTGAYGFVLILLGIFLWSLIQAVVRTAGYTR